MSHNLGRLGRDWDTFGDTIVGVPACLSLSLSLSPKEEEEEEGSLADGNHTTYESTDVGVEDATRARTLPGIWERSRKSRANLGGSLPEGLGHSGTRVGLGRSGGATMQASAGSRAAQVTNGHGCGAWDAGRIGAGVEVRDGA